MLAVRIAFSDSEKTQARAHWLEAHKAYLRNAEIRILQSGPFTPAGEGPPGALIIAEVDDLVQLKRFSDADPFVKAQVYATVHIAAWNVTINNAA